MKRTLMGAMATVAVVVATQVQAQTPANLPSGRDLLVKSLHATGADTIMPKHATIRLTGTLSTQGITAPIVLMKAPGAVHIQIDIDGFGTIEQGYEDGTAWGVTPQTGAAIMTGSAAGSMRRQAEWLDGPDQYTTLKNEGLVKFQGKDAYKVTMTSKDSVTTTRYFDPATGYAIGTTSTQDMGGTPAEITTATSDFRNVGGMMFPFKQSQTGGPADTDITFDKIEFDAFDKGILVLPQTVVALKKGG